MRAIDAIRKLRWILLATSPGRAEPLVSALKEALAAIEPGTSRQPLRATCSFCRRRGARLVVVLAVREEAPKFLAVSEFKRIGPEAERGLRFEHLVCSRCVDGATDARGEPDASRLELADEVTRAVRASGSRHADQILGALAPLFRGGVWSRSGQFRCTLCGALDDEAATAWFGRQVTLCLGCLDEAGAALRAR